MSDLGDMVNKDSLNHPGSDRWTDGDEKSEDVEPSLSDMFMDILIKEKLTDSYFRLSFRHSPKAVTVAVQDYMNALETGETRETCYCVWAETLDGKAFRILEEHPLCRVHSKEGRILGFLMYWAKGCVL